jgi:hypothetical protein
MLNLVIFVSAIHRIINKRSLTAAFENMRFVIRAQIPTEAGNKMMQNPNGIADIEKYMQKVKAETAYFFEAGGERTMVFIINMDGADQMAVIAEPLFMMGAKVEFHPVMLIEDLKKAASHMGGK